VAGEKKQPSRDKRFFQLLSSSTKPLDAQIHRILVEQDDVIIKGEFTTEMLETGKVVTSPFFIHFVVNADRKIVEYTLLEDSYAVALSLQK
jgi:ketosteroid isomerase-like protein